jgi:hypothetical protein
MKEESKYYTPEKWEFYEGFKYERVFEDGRIQVEYFDHDGINCFDPNSGQVLDYIRVKALDREDIESLEWKCEEEFKDGRMSFLGLFKSKRKGLLTQHSIMYVKSTNWCLIANEEDQTMFAGTIKNKSELKRILKQIGV